MFNLPSREIKVAEDSKFSVHGLSLSDVTSLYWQSPEELSNLFAEVVEDYQAGRVLDVLHKVMIKLPSLVADTIALASGVELNDPNFKNVSNKFKHLPMGIQGDAIDAILDLTFSSDMPPKKMMGLFMDALTEMMAQK